MTKPLRQKMPTVAAWIDEMREAFGAELINASIKAGIDGQPVFFAKENGHSIGTEIPYRAERTVSMADIDIKPFNSTAAHSASSAKGK